MMLSRLALKAVRDTKPCLVLLRTSSSVTTPSSSEVRDEVNFPNPKRAINPAKVRMGFIPDDWFQFFYSKTGVTGPYVFGASFLTFLYSKEILIIEHEFWAGISLGILIISLVKKFGPKVSVAIDKEIEEYENSLTKFKEDSMTNLTDTIKSEKDAQWRAQGQSLLFDAKRENIALQLEAAYRERLAHAHSEVKKKLDYQLETANIKTRMEQKHMTNWIIQNVRKSITPTQEAATLKKCIADLKNIANV